MKYPPPMPPLTEAEQRDYHRRALKGSADFIGEDSLPNDGEWYASQLRNIVWHAYRLLELEGRAHYCPCRTLDELKGE